MKIKTNDYEITRGDDWYIDVKVKHQTDPTHDYTGATATCVLRDAGGELALHDFQPIVTFAAGEMNVRLELPHTVCEKLDPGKTFGNIRFTLAGGSKHTYFRFSLNILPIY